MHVVENWCYFGSYRSEDELADAATQQRSHAFDMDTYKLLVRYLMGRKKIDVVSGLQAMRNLGSGR